MSKQRSFRPRTKFPSEEDGAEEDGPPDIKPKPPTGAPKAALKPPSAPAANIPKKDSKPSLLSFDDDTGEDVGPGGGMGGKKKDKGSKSKIGRAQGLPELPAVAATTQLSSAGEYTADRMKDLQRNTLNFSAAKFALQPAEGGAGAQGQAQGQVQQEPMLKLSGTFKPAGLPKDDRFSINETATAKASKPSAPTPPVPAFRAAGAPAAASGQPQAASITRVTLPDEEEEDEDDDAMHIPNEDTIRLAKAKRERLRQAHLAPDYIPLGGASRLLQSSKSAAEAEPGEVGSGSDAEGELEDAMRIKFTVQGETRGDRKAYARTVAADEDADAFADEQLRKAVSRSKAAMPAPMDAGYAHGEGYPAGYGQAAGAMEYYTQAGQAYPGAGAYQGAQGYPAAGYGAGGAYPGAGGGGGITLAGAMARGRMEAIMGGGQSVLAALQEGVARLTLSHKASQANLIKTANNLTNSLAKVELIEQDSKAAGEKYVYVQEMRTYMANLIDCLTDKSAVVEGLEDSLMELREERASAGKDTVEVLEAELLRSAQAAIGAALGVLSREGAMAAAREAAQSAATACEEDMEEEGGAGPVVLDEYGRNVNMGRQREAQERRRQRKAVVLKELSRLEALANGAPLSVTEEDWEIENETQASRYIQRHKQVMDAADGVFSDAGAEFATLMAVKQRLEEFKARYPKDYASTYMHMSSPALFAPFVRLELLRWDPLYADDNPARSATAAAAAGNGVPPGGAAAPLDREGVHRGFDKQAWYDNLFFYGMGPNPEAMAETDMEADPDSQLVPQLVRKLVLPLATHMIQKCWDPLSLKQSMAASTIVVDLLSYVPPDEPAMAELLGHVIEGLKRALERVSLPPWPPVALEASDLAKAVLSRRFQSAVRLLRCIGVWEGLLSRSLLLGLALGQLVGQQLLQYLRAAASEAVAQPYLAVGRMEAVAAALPTQWFTGGRPSEAKAFMELMESLASRLEGQKDNKARYAAPAARLAKELQRLGSTQRAAQLAAAFGLQLTQ